MYLCIIFLNNLYLIGEKVIEIFVITKDSVKGKPLQSPIRPKRWRGAKNKTVWAIEVDDWCIVPPKDCIPEAIEGYPLRDNRENFTEFPIEE